MACVPSPLDASGVRLTVPPPQPKPHPFPSLATHRHKCNAELAVLMLLAHLLAPCPLRPDMEHWFGQDKSRISRFSSAALFHIFNAFKYTLSFQNDRHGPLVPPYAMKMALAVGMPAPVHYRVWGLVGGVYRYCLPPLGE